MLDWATCAAVERDPQKLAGAFPGVTPPQADAVLEHAARSGQAA